MSFRTQSSSTEAGWWLGNQTAFPTTLSPSQTSVMSPAPSVGVDSVIMVPARGTETPNTRSKMPGIAGCTSPEVRLKIGEASPETARRVAVRLFESLRQHGLHEEAEHAFGADVKGREEAAEGERRKEEELLGMEYLLKDGFVSYLRDVAKITPPIPQQVVRFSGIKYSKRINTSRRGYETFGNKLLGCFMGPLKSLLFSRRSKSVDQVQILHGIDGYIMPGSLTLLIGPPGSGKSSLLQILAGRVAVGRRDDPSISLEGVVRYNDKTASEIRLSRLIAYVGGQLNKHIPFLSVRETLEFARDCTQGLRPENFTPQMRKFFAHALVEGQDPFLEYVLEILGLKKLEHQQVGGDAVSDIDRQRLTTAELALGTYSVLLYDQPLSGSDPAATYDLVDTIRTISRIQQSSAVMALNQPSQEVLDLFDRVILLGDGHVLYQGPRQDALTYFARLGYMKPSHVESGEFLEDIASGDGVQYLVPGSPSLGLDDLVECYRDSDHYRDVMRIINGGEDLVRTYWIESEPGVGLSLKTPSKFHAAVSPDRRREVELVVAKLSSKVGHSGGIESSGRVQVGDVVTAISINNEELQYLAVGSTNSQQERAARIHSMLKRARGHIRLQVERYEDVEDEQQSQWEQFQRPFVQTWWNSTKTLLHRQFKIARRLHMLIKLRLFQASVLGVFAGTLFYKFGGRYDQQQMNSVRALGFVSTMSIMLLNLVQLPLYMLQRPIFYKHRAQRFFRTSTYAAAHSIINLPQTFIEAFVYTVCSYFLAGLTLANTGAVFFGYLALMFLVAYFGSSLFFFLSAVSSIPEVGNALAGLLVSIFLLFSGFVIYPSNIPTYWKWLLYLNPIRWANISFCDLQFSYGYTDSCNNYQDQLSFCKEYPNMKVGKAYLAFSQLSEDASGKTWLPFVILVAWTVLANLLALLALKKIEFPGTSQSLPQPRHRSAMISNYLYDTKSDWSSLDDYMQGSEDFSSSKYALPHEKLQQRIRMGGDGDDGGVGNWIEAFRVDMEMERARIPVLPVMLLFLDLSFTRQHGGNLKEKMAVFEHVSGYAEPGTMLALLGGSQASTTTLLKCLAGRAPPDGDLTGDIQANGTKPSVTFSRVVGYVEKLDAHQPYLSVRESLQFSAGLRLDRETSFASRCMHVELVLDQLGLKPYASQLVGSLRDATGKTFEIAKKLTIAVELAANPSMLFLEEPISGLDAAGTSQILSILSELAASSLIIIAMLNHPNTRALSFFHQVLILTQEGHQAYFGPVGLNCNEVLGYFTSIPKLPQYFQSQNPVSYIMGVLGMGIQKRGSELANFAEAYKNSSLYESNNRDIAAMKRSSKQKRLKTVQSKYSASYSRQAGLVLLRTQRFLWRNVQYTYGRLIGCIMIGLLMGSLYYQIEYTNVYGVTSRSLYIYMQCILIGVISANNVIPQIGTDRLVYFRERRARMYLPIFYPVSWAVGEIPYFVMATLAVVGIGNGMAGIATGTAAEFLMYWLTLFLFTICVTYFGIMLTFLSPVPTLAAFAVSIVMSMWVSASGVVVAFSDIKFYKWMYWTNPFQFVINTLTSISFYCDTAKCVSKCSCPRLPDSLYVWDRVASLRSLSEGRISSDVTILSGMCILFATLAFLFFVILKHNSPLPG